MALNLQALSITSIFSSIVSFFKSQENNSKWKDLTTGAEGIFLIRLLSNVMSNISYRLVTARRENYLSTANLLSSNLGIAVNLGYSASRGTNQKRLIELLPNGNYTISKLSIIGTYSSEYDIISLEDKVLLNNTPTEIKTVIGKIKELTFTAGTDAVKVFTQYTSGISEDYILLKDGTEVPTSNIIKKLKDDFYLVRTNPYSSVDILYLNNSPTGQYRYGTETEFTLRYVELADVNTISYTSSMFSYGTLNNVLTIDNYVPFEKVDSIKVNAPLNHEIQNLIRSKADYSQRVKETIPNVVETAYTPITPTYTLVTYLKDDYTILTDAQITNLNQILDEENYFGTPLPDITTPKREIIDLEITLNLLNKYTDISDIDVDIRNILDNNYSVALNQTFSTYDLERLLEDNLSYVKYARVGYKSNTRTDNTKYQLGTIIKSGNYYYKSSKILGTTGATEPNWNLPIDTTINIDTELKTVDNNIIWKAYKRLNVDNIQVWSSSDKHYIGDYVYSDSYPSYMFKCVDLIKSSNTSAPTVTNTTIGDFVVDGNVIWVCKTYNNTYDNRTNTTVYRLGDSVNIGNLSFECVSYIGTSGGASPSFELADYDIDSFTSSTFLLDGDKTQFFISGDVIKALTDENTYTFSIASSVYNEAITKTVITVNQTIDTDYTYLTLTPSLKGTQDGELLWELISDTSSITYDWNVYNVFSYTLTTS